MSDLQPHVEVWEERDRLHIHLLQGDRTVAEWWDEDAREMFEDGFFKRGKELEASVIEYAKSVGLLGRHGAKGTLGEHVPDPSPAQAKVYNLDVSSPEHVPAVLRLTADKYREDAAGLDSAHQDKSAGRPWRKIARMLDSVADRIAKAI